MNTVNNQIPINQFTTVTFKLMPDELQEQLIMDTLNEYLSTCNEIMNSFIKQGRFTKITSKDVNAKLPSSLKCQAIKRVTGDFISYREKVNEIKKYDSKSAGRIKYSRYKEATATWDNQSYIIEEGFLSFRVYNPDGQQMIKVPALIRNEDFIKIKNSKKRGIRIGYSGGKLLAYIPVDNNVVYNENEVVMGVDVGVKVPAVCYLSNGKAKFFGNGRQIGFKRRKFKLRRESLISQGKIDVLKDENNKEQKFMENIDHNISRQIVNYAVENNVGMIKLEKLKYIRKTINPDIENSRGLYTWSFYRLQHHIEYKAKIAGIRVVSVNPYNTSKICPACGSLNYPKSREYICNSCGYKGHRDLVGAINIMRAK